MTRLDEDEFLFMERFRSGDGQAFKLFYDLTVHVLSLTIGGLLAKLYIPNIQLQEDIVAEAYTRLFAHRASMQNYIHARRALFIIAKNLAITERRLKNKEYERKEILLYMQEESIEVESEILKDQILGIVRKAKEQLNGPKSIKIIELLFYENKSVREVSRIMDHSPQTTRNLKTRTLKRLEILVTNELKLKNIQI